MATRTVVCPDCDEPLVYGHLSCSRCGALLASVAGGRRRQPLRRVPVEEEGWLTDDDDLTPNGETAMLNGDGPGETETDRGTAERAPSGEEPTTDRPWTAPAEPPHVVDELAEPEALVEPEAPAEPAPPAEPEAPAEPAPPAERETPAEHATLEEPVTIEETEPVAEQDANADPEPEPVPDPESSTDVEPASATPEPSTGVAVAGDAVGPADDVAADPADAGVAPGDVDDAAEPPPPQLAQTSAAHERGPVEPDLGWLDAPAAVLRPSFTGRRRLDLAATRDDTAPDPDSDPVVATTPPAGAWLPPAIDGAIEPALEPSRGPAAAGPAQSQETRSAAADAAFAARNDLVSWLVALGSGLATLGFLLPWARVIPFSGGLGGYTDRWGLAIPSHALVLVAAAVLLGFAMVPNKLPTWIRNGVLPLGLGALVTGLVWPYVAGGFGFDVGSLLTAIAGVVLVVGGVLGLRATRHDETSPAV